MESPHCDRKTKVETHKFYFPLDALLTKHITNLWPLWCTMACLQFHLWSLVHLSDILFLGWGLKNTHSCCSHYTVTEFKILCLKLRDPWQQMDALDGLTYNGVLSSGLLAHCHVLLSSLTIRASMGQFEEVHSDRRVLPVHLDGVLCLAQHLYSFNTRDLWREKQIRAISVMHSKQLKAIFVYVSLCNMTVVFLFTLNTRCESCKSKHFVYQWYCKITLYSLNVFVIHG